MFIAALQFVAGLVALYYGADWLVRGAGRLARRFGVSALIVGLTVVAFGTSAPELVVSGFAAGRGQGDVAVGNVIGSNIFNVLAILGATALIFPIMVQSSLVRRELPIMLGASLLLPLVVLDGSLSRLDGFMLLAAFATYLGLMIWLARKGSGEIALLASVDDDLIGGDEQEGAPLGRNIMLIAAGLVTLVAGARLLVDSSVFFARAAGLSELVIGLTIVAAGTSLPELATSAVAALRREADIAIGNVIGSNIFNMLAVLGIASSITPIPFDAALFRFELPVMVAGSVALLPLALTRGRLERWEGALLLLGYAAFLVVLFMRAQPV
jgi:cation:H+ antiporter